MKKWIPWIIAAIFAFAFYNWAVGFNIAAVEKQETVKAKWADVESVYQRRADLIPNLVNTVKGYAAHEKETLEGVITARSKATSTNIDPSNVTPEQLAAFQQSQSGLSSALSRLMVVVEKYPDLKANQSFLNLQSQIEGSENRITIERMRYNDIAKEYNVLIRKFPDKLLAGMFGFNAMVLFESFEGSDQAPTVDF